jgi:leucyl-tRNA synthetase
VADYVLISYGTGAIMAVPAHDERDHEFAEKFNIEIKQVITNPNGDNETTELPYSGPGHMVNSGEYDGLEANTCKSKIISDLETKGVGKGAINYKLRDWIFSRQRYWGEPIPLVWVSQEDYEKAKNIDGSCQRCTTGKSGHLR